MDLLLFPISVALSFGELAIAGLRAALGVVVLVVKSVLAIANLLMAGLGDLIMLMSAGLRMIAPAAFHVAVVVVEVVWIVLVTVTQLVWGVVALVWGVVWCTLCLVMSLFGHTISTLAAFLHFTDELMWIDVPYAWGKLRTWALRTHLFSLPSGLDLSVLLSDLSVLLQQVLNLVYLLVLLLLVVLAVGVLLVVTSYVVPGIQSWRRRHSHSQTGMRVHQRQTVNSGRMRRTDSQRDTQPGASTASVVGVRPSVSGGSAAAHTGDRSVGSNLQQRVRQLEVELENSRERSLCVVCLDQEKEMLLKPCNHLCVCSGCQGQLGGACPVCRAAVQRAERVFHP